VLCGLLAVLWLLYEKLDGCDKAALLSPQRHPPFCRQAGQPQSSSSSSSSSSTAAGR
jgi:hypothetical protein